MSLRNRINYSNVGLMAGPVPSYSSHEAHHADSDEGFRRTKLRSLKLLQAASFDFSISIKLPSVSASERLYKNSNDDDTFTYNLDCNFYEDIGVEIVQRPMQMVFDKDSD